MAGVGSLVARGADMLMTRGLPNAAGKIAGFMKSGASRAKDALSNAYGKAAAIKAAGKEAAETVSKEGAEAAGKEGAKAVTTDAAEAAGKEAAKNTGRVGSTLKRARNLGLAVAGGGFALDTAGRVILDPNHSVPAAAANALMDGPRFVGELGNQITADAKADAEKKHIEALQQKKAEGKTSEAENAEIEAYEKKQADEASKNVLMSAVQKIAKGDIFGALGDVVSSRGGMMSVGGLAAVLIGSLSGSGIVSTIGKILVPIGVADLVSGGKLFDSVGGFFNDMINTTSASASEALESESKTAVVPATQEQVESALKGEDGTNKADEAVNDAESKDETKSNAGMEAGM